MIDRFLLQQLYVWTYESIKSDPQRFGGDASNPLIMQKFLVDHYGDATIADLAPFQMSLLSSISRIKNKLLVANPQFDNRKRFKPKHRYEA